MSEPVTDRPPRRVIFDPTINLGHILTFVGFMAAGLVAYKDLDKRLAVQEIRTNAVEAEAGAEKQRIRDSLSELKGDVKEVKRGVDELARRRP